MGSFSIFVLCFVSLSISLSFCYATSLYVCTRVCMYVCVNKNKTIYNNYLADKPNSRSTLTRSESVRVRRQTQLLLNFNTLFIRQGIQSLPSNVCVVHATREIACNFACVKVIIAVHL